MCTCIPIGFLKVWVFVAALTNFGIGIGFIILGDIIKGFDGDILAIIPDPDSIRDIIKLINLVCIIVGAFVIFLGLVTIVAGLKQWRCLLCIYIIFALLFLIICIVFGAVGYMAPTYLEEFLGKNTKEQCMKEQITAGADVTFSMFRIIWCVGTPKQFDVTMIPPDIMADLEAQGIKIPVLDDPNQPVPPEYAAAAASDDSSFKISMEEANSYLCKCKISEENLDKWEDESQKALIKEGIDPNGTITLNSCEKFKNLSGDQGDSAGASQDMDTIVKLFAAIEKMFSCTGICNGDIKYYFYDVNNGPPDDEDKKNEGCFMQMRYFIDGLLNAFWLFGLIGTILYILNIVFVCSLMCHKKKTQQDVEGQDEAKVI